MAADLAEKTSCGMGYGQDWERKWFIVSQKVESGQSLLITGETLAIHLSLLQYAYQTNQAARMTREHPEVHLPN